jgi:hypothetical protein
MFLRISPIFFQSHRDLITLQDDLFVGSVLARKDGKTQSLLIVGKGIIQIQHWKMKGLRIANGKNTKKPAGMVIHSNAFQ